MEMKRIVLTGGPCAGKTTALSWISNYFSKNGWMKPPPSSSLPACRQSISLIPWPFRSS